LAQVMYDSLRQSLQFGQAEIQTDEAADVACQQLNNRTLHDASLVVMRAPALKRIWFPQSGPTYSERIIHCVSAKNMKFSCICM